MTIKQQGGVFGRHPEFSSVSVPDGGAIYVGSDQDLKIYHDGSNSHILDQGTGGLYLRGSNEIALRSEGNKNIFLGITDGAAYMYHNGGVKLATASSGVSITGNVIVASGNGIDFSATSGTGTSELFDDYEEGTWTPSYEPSTGAFGSIGYDGYRLGKYIKVGKLVHLEGRLRTTGITVGTASGQLYLGGLPFAIDGSFNVSISAAYSFTGTAPDSATNISSNVGLFNNATGTQVSDLNTAATGNYARFSFTYYTTA